ncbi:VF_A0006 family four-cysteine protein [Photobacterium kasasachensis]|uniref:VF_A0006 family four-cysteine protein n=1 Tax=Photobacterium kasasachensis TaxID=2910240 RepID=UPI003D0C1D5F
MKWLSGIIVIAVSLHVGAKEDKAGYEDCILAHVSGAEDTLAANLMTYACHRLYIDNFMLSEQDQGYYQCLLDFMPDAKKAEITLQIKRTCNDKHRSLFR